MVGLMTSTCIFPARFSISRIQNKRSNGSERQVFILGATHDYKVARCSIFYCCSRYAQMHIEGRVHWTPLCFLMSEACHVSLRRIEFPIALISISC